MSNLALAPQSNVHGEFLQLVVLCNRVLTDLHRAKCAVSDKYEWLVLYSLIATLQAHLHIYA